MNAIFGEFSPFPPFPPTSARLHHPPQRQSAGCHSFRHPSLGSQTHVNPSVCLARNRMRLTLPHMLHHSQHRIGGKSPVPSTQYPPGTAGLSLQIHPSSAEKLIQGLGCSVVKIFSQEDSGSQHPWALITAYLSNSKGLS